LGAFLGQGRIASSLPVRDTNLYLLVKLLKLRKLSRARFAKETYKSLSIQLVLNGKQTRMVSRVSVPLIEFLDKSNKRI